MSWTKTNERYAWRQGVVVFEVDRSGEGFLLRSNQVANDAFYGTEVPLCFDGMLVSVPLSTATPIYLCSVLASLWVYVRLDWRVR
jgi:hypothetical protein